MSDYYPGGGALQAFTERVVRLIRAIPAGRVASYGDIAAAAESPRAARQVVRILHAMSGKHQLPWWRVVNKAGAISLAEGDGAELQRQRLLDEGVEVDESGRIQSLSRYRMDVLQLVALARQ
ncbi:MAG: MGMT family protein [Candidatus Pelagadaptatus aseana]|uniref:MGMT family protein n=1 Tax=Candidatus Pelagadaptatus aseana TaxID=3120508 RepID=UPI0039B35D33